MDLDHLMWGVPDIDAGIAALLSTPKGPLLLT
jgi:hypothetical protein